MSNSRVRRSIRALSTAVELAGSQSELARRSDGAISQQNVCYWLKHGVPAKKARAVYLAARRRVPLSALSGA